MFVSVPRASFASKNRSLGGGAWHSRRSGSAIVLVLVALIVVRYGGTQL